MLESRTSLTASTRPVSAGPGRRVRGSWRARTLRLACAATLMVSVQPAGPVSAQTGSSNPPDLLLWVVNAGVGTLSAWIQGRSSDASLGRMLAGGIAGGSLMYAGQRVLATRRLELRLVGIETVALGAYVARNVGRRKGALSDLVLPVFPFYVRVRNNGVDPRVSVRVSGAALLSTVRMATHPGRKLDLLESLYSGAVVFRRENDGSGCTAVGAGLCADRVGEHQFGAVACTNNSPCDPDELITHELLHVSQDVRDAVLFAVPASDYFLARAGSAGHFLSRFVVVDAVLPFMLLNGIVNPARVGYGCGLHKNYYECEVEALLRR